MVTEKAYFAAGCFWCVEAIFRRLKGVLRVTSGYAGGSKERPTYEEVCSGETGHAEAIEVQFNPAAVTYGRLLEVFFAMHDPTSKNRQGADLGTQYRSAIFFSSDEQHKVAEAVKARLEHEGYFSKPIMTEVVPANAFFAAEDYHQNFYDKNPEQPYCQAVINPKLAKLRQSFASLLKKEA